MQRSDRRGGDSAAYDQSSINKSIYDCRGISHPDLNGALTKRNNCEEENHAWEDVGTGDDFDTPGDEGLNWGRY
jgi:hypothetical protein